MCHYKILAYKNTNKVLHQIRTAFLKLAFATLIVCKFVPLRSDW